MRKSHRHGRPSFKVPNRLILDGALSYSARRMGAVLYSRRNPLGACRKRLSRLAELAGCSVTTARKALEELEARGHITRCRNYKYSEKLTRPVYDKYTYHCDLRFTGGFTLVPRELFSHELKSSAFVLCLYLYLEAGNGTKAFPSLNDMSRKLCMGRSTVCRELKTLAGAGIIYIRGCMKVNHAHGHNNYFFLCSVSCPETVHTAQDAPRNEGRVSVLHLLLRLVSRLRKQPRAGAAPFPCLDYMPWGRRFQVVSSPGGSPKIGKLS